MSSAPVGSSARRTAWIVDQRPCNGHSLHLSPRHLIGTLMELIPQPHLSQHLLCPLAALPARDAGDSQCQLHIREDGLVRNQIVALENEANGVVSVGIPVLIPIFFGGDAVDH